MQVHEEYSRKHPDKKIKKEFDSFLFLALDSLASF